MIARTLMTTSSWCRQRYARNHGSQEVAAGRAFSLSTLGNSADTPDVHTLELPRVAEPSAATECATDASSPDNEARRRHTIVLLLMSATSAIMTLDLYLLAYTLRH